MGQKNRKGKTLSPSVRDFLKIFFFLCVWILVGIGWTRDASSEPLEQFGEYQVKAAFLYNFGKFIEWPPRSFQDDKAPLILGILGKDPFGDSLDSFKGKKIGSREFLVKVFPKLETLEKCHILFIGASEKDQLSKVLKTIGGWNVLTVGDIPGFCQAGGILNFAIEEKKVRFEINPQAAQRHGLKVSSQLVKLAKIIQEN